MRRRHLIGLTLLTVLTFTFSGCFSTKVNFATGPEDYFEIPVGTELYVQNFMAEDGEPAMKKIRTSKQGHFVSNEFEELILQSRHVRAK
jgi:hypothetical protein